MKFKKYPVCNLYDMGGGGVIQKHEDEELQLYAPKLPSAYYVRYLLYFSCHQCLTDVNRTCQLKIRKSTSKRNIYTL